MKVNIIIEYRDKAINEKIKDDDIITLGKYGGNILGAKKISGYKVLGGEESKVRIGFFKREKKLIFYYERDVEENQSEEVNVVEVVEEIEDEDVNLVGESEEIIKTYKIDLEAFGIKNNGTDPQETSKGIMDAFSYVKSNKSIRKIIFPKGVYLIHEDSPIIFDMKDLIVDFNRARFEAIRNGGGKGSVFLVEEGAENLILTNGIISEYKPLKKLNNYSDGYVGTIGININAGVNIELNNLNISGLSMCGIVIESFESSEGNKNKGPLAKNIIIKGNIFEDNKFCDLLASRGENIRIENNKFTSKVELWERLINYKVINNSFYNSKILFRYVGNIECYENEYINSNLELIYIGGALRNGTPNIHNEAYKATRITSVDDVNIINSKFENYSRQAIKIGGSLNGCSIEGDRIQLGTSLNECKLLNIIVENINNSTISNSYIKNCIFYTNTSSERFTVKNSEIVDCKLLVSKHSDIINLNIENNSILMSNRNEEFFNIIVGKVRNVILKNNKIKNLVGAPVINISDAILYTIKCELTMENNEVIQEIAPSVINGIEIETGWLEIFDLGNNIEIATLLSQIYYENKNIVVDK